MERSNSEDTIRRPGPRPVEGRRIVQSSLRTIDSQSLFGGSHEIGIEHQGSLYRLKITRQGKLILNK